MAWPNKVQIESLANTAAIRCIFRAKSWCEVVQSKTILCELTIWYSLRQLLDREAAILTHVSQWRHQRSKEAKSFRSQKILQLGHSDTLFPQKKLTTFFICRPQNTCRQRPFHRQNKTNKAVRYVHIFIFCSHYYRSKAIRRAMAEPGLEPGWWIFQSGHLTWRALM